MEWNIVALIRIGKEWEMERWRTLSRWPYVISVMCFSPWECREQDAIEFLQVCKTSGVRKRTTERKQVMRLEYGRFASTVPKNGVLVS